MQQQTIPVQVNDETRYLKAEMCNRLYAGSIALGNINGTLHQLQAIAKHCYPKDPTTVTEICEVLFTNHLNNNFWAWASITDLPVFPISAFFAETAEGVKRNADIVRLYYQIDFTNCHMDWDYTIVPSIEAVTDAIRMIEGNLDDKQREASVTIKGIGMSDNQFKEWQKESVETE